MTDRPYTEETLDLAEGAVAKACGGRDDDRTAARYVLDALFEAGLLVTPRIQQDTELYARAFIWTTSTGERLVLDPREVDIVLPLGGTVSDRQIHERILTRCDPSWYGMRDNPINLFAAMRAVVEVCREHQAEGVDGHPTTVELIDPSALLATIARELGIREAP